MRSKDKKRINDYVYQLSKETSGIIEEVIELTYYMRGSIQYSDMMMLSVPERTAVNDFIDKRFEAELKKPSYAIY
jgi:hypothetical protein